MANDIKKISLQGLQSMVREAVALELDKKKIKDVKPDVDEECVPSEDKKTKKGAFPGAAPPFGSKNESTQRVTLEQLKEMVKEAVSKKLSEALDASRYADIGDDAGTLGISQDIASELPDPSGVVGDDSADLAARATLGDTAGGKKSFSVMTSELKSEIEHIQSRLEAGLLSKNSIRKLSQDLMKYQGMLAAFENTPKVGNNASPKAQEMGINTIVEDKK